MGRSNQNFVYTPHKRRGPISAEFTSPGPAAISLPGTIGSKLKFYIPIFIIQKIDDWKRRHSNSCLEPRFLLDTKLTVNRIWWAFIWWQMTGWHWLTGTKRSLLEMVWSFWSLLSWVQAESHNTQPHLEINLIFWTGFKVFYWLV